MPSFPVQRRVYACLIVLTIITGLLSRRTNLVPAATGDALYAVMMYLIVRFFATGAAVAKVALIALCICWTIECSQLYQAGWINQVRNTLPGKLILGRGFLWTDLLAYAVGIIAAALADHFFTVQKKKRD